MLFQISVLMHDGCIPAGRSHAFHRFLQHCLPRAQGSQRVGMCNAGRAGERPEAVIEPAVSVTLLLVCDELTALCNART